MRYCLVDDLLVGARMLSRLSVDQRAQQADQLLHEAHAAHLYTKRFGQPHPVWGNGSLMARALAEGSAQSSPQVCFASLAVRADAIVRFRRPGGV